MLTGLSGALMKYSSHYVTHSDSSSSQTSGGCQWGSYRPPENRPRAERFTFIPSDPPYLYLNQISVIELVTLTVPDLKGRRENISLADRLRCKAPLRDCCGGYRPETCGGSRHTVFMRIKLKLKRLILRWYELKAFV